MSPSPQVLTAPLVLCRECLPLHDVEGVVKLLDKWLDTFSSRWTVKRACVAGLSRRALDYLATRDRGWNPDTSFVDPWIGRVAVKNGFLHVLQWVREHYPERIVWKGWNRTSLVDDAAPNGHLAIVKWLHENYNDECTTRAMDLAASNGHLEVVEWMHEHRSEGCTSGAMDFAARNGHLEVVRFLHENRSEGCAKQTLHRAATNGHIAVVRFLHENRHEGCTSEALRQAAARGHLEVVQYLLGNRNEGHPPSALRTAAKYGQLAVAELLSGFVREQRRGDDSIRDAAEIALEAGRVTVARMLKQKLKRPRLQ